MTTFVEASPFFVKNAKWRPDNSVSKGSLPSTLRPIICSEGSLTTLLTELSNDSFQVTVLAQRKSKAFWHETRALNVDVDRICLVREVNLSIEGVPVVYARSIIPIHFLTQTQHGLKGLGNSPLGHLLFKDGRMRKSKREFTTLQHNSLEPAIHGRRTPYNYRGGTILVSEFFLPSLEQFI